MSAADPPIAPAPDHSMTTPRRPHRVLSYLELDFHVIVTLLFRGWTVIAGGITIIVIPLCLSSVEQGYYYTFASVLGLQIFFELGMNQVVSQITAHEIAHLGWLDPGSLSGDAVRLDRLGSMARMLRRWYLIASGLFAAIVGLGGSLFFMRHQDLPVSDWLGPWIIMTTTTAANLYLSPSLALLEGAGRVGEVARMRLYQSMAGCLLFSAALLLGLRLWATPIVPLTAVVATSLWLRRDGRLVDWLRQRRLQSSATVNWRSEIFPFQWRIALSWISGYFIFQLFVPMLFENQGAAQAGRFGLVLAIFNALQSIGMSWVYSKSPSMAQHVARGERPALRALFLRLIKPSTTFTLLSSLAVIGVTWFATRHGYAFIHRLSSIEVVSLLAAATVVNSPIFAMAVFMRAHKEEPLMPQSVFCAVLMLAIAHWASQVSVELTAGLYFLTTLCIGLPWTLVIFKRYWRRGT